MSEWIKVDKFGDPPKEKQFLLSDEYGYVYTGSTAFDYYDAEYWLPMPKFPIAKPVITNDHWVTLLAKQGDLHVGGL